MYGNPLGSKTRKKGRTESDMYKFVAKPCKSTVICEEHPYISCYIRGCRRPANHFWLAMDLNGRWGSFYRCCYHAVNTGREILCDLYTGLCGFCGNVDVNNAGGTPHSKNRYCNACQRKVWSVMPNSQSNPSAFGSNVYNTYRGLAGEIVSKDTYDALHLCEARVIAQDTFGHMFIQTAWKNGQYVTTVRNNLHYVDSLTEKLVDPVVYVKVWEHYNLAEIKTWHKMLADVLAAAVMRYPSTDSQEDLDLGGA